MFIFIFAQMSYTLALKRPFSIAQMSIAGENTVFQKSVRTETTIV